MVDAAHILKSNLQVFRVVQHMYSQMHRLLYTLFYYIIFAFKAPHQLLAYEEARVSPRGYATLCSAITWPCG